MAIFATRDYGDGRINNEPTLREFDSLGDAIEWLLAVYAPEDRELGFTVAAVDADSQPGVYVVTEIRSLSGWELI